MRSFSGFGVGSRASESERISTCEEAVAEIQLLEIQAAQKGTGVRVAGTRLTLCLFAGIRPGVPDGEITKLKPEDVNLEIDIINIRPEVSKVAGPGLTPYSLRRGLARGDRQPAALFAGDLAGAAVGGAGALHAARAPTTRSISTRFSSTCSRAV